MKVKVEYRNKDLQLLEIKEYEFQEYFDKLSRRLAGILYLVEYYKEDLIEYDQLRNTILDLAGHLKRLPQGIVFEEE